MSKKSCSKCQRELPLSSFSIKGKRKDGTSRYHSYCKSCLKEYGQKNYCSNKKKVLKRVKDGKNRRKEVARMFIIRYLSDKCCVDCGFDDNLALQFDHVNPKNKKHNISKMVKQGYALDKIKEEIRKCVIRCANCHQIRTAHQFGYYKVNMTNTRR